jgi:hypothetical protein
MKMNMMMIVHAFRLASCLHSYQVASRMENIFIFQSSIKKTKKNQILVIYTSNYLNKH